MSVTTATPRERSRDELELIDAAKARCMARFRVPESVAYRALRTLAMRRRKRLPIIAQSVVRYGVVTVFGRDRQLLVEDGE